METLCYFIEKGSPDGATGLWLNRLDGGFTRDPDKAKRFDTRHEAEDFRKNYPLLDCFVSEHIFMNNDKLDSEKVDSEEFNLITDENLKEAEQTLNKMANQGEEPDKKEDTDCKCGSESTGWTTVKCCNKCGKSVEPFWKLPQPDKEQS